jgi:hypothetical protein
MKKLTHWNLFLHHVIYYCRNKMINHRSWSIPLITIFILSYLFYNQKYEDKSEDYQNENEFDKIFSK